MLLSNGPGDGGLRLAAKSQTSVGKPDPVRLLGIHFFPTFVTLRAHLHFDRKVFGKYKWSWNLELKKGAQDTSMIMHIRCSGYLTLPGTMPSAARHYHFRHCALPYTRQVRSKPLLRSRLYLLDIFGSICTLSLLRTYRTGASVKSHPIRSRCAKSLGLGIGGFELPALYSKKPLKFYNNILSNYATISRMFLPQEDW
jgi:hypothetical protein